VAAVLWICCSAGVTAAQSIVGPEKVRLMATAVQMAGHACEGMLGQYLGATDGSRIYIIECRGGDRFVYMEMPGGKVGVTPCAVMRAQCFAC
jgi:hypothetical protein